MTIVALMTVSCQTVEPVSSPGDAVEAPATHGSVTDVPHRHAAEWDETTGDADSSGTLPRARTRVNR